MTNKQKEAYGEPEALKNILQRTLAGSKYRLECGHHVTFSEVLGNDVIIRNGKELKIICTQCGY